MTTWSIGYISTDVILVPGLTFKRTDSPYLDQLELSCKKSNYLAATILWETQGQQLVMCKYWLAWTHFPTGAVKGSLQTEARKSPTTESTRFHLIPLVWTLIQPALLNSLTSSQLTLTPFFYLLTNLAFVCLTRESMLLRIFFPGLVSDQIFKPSPLRAYTFDFQITSSQVLQKFWPLEIYRIVTALNFIKIRNSKSDLLYNIVLVLP